MMRQDAKRRLWLGFASIGLSVVAAGAAGCGEAEPPPPPPKAAVAAPVEDTSKGKKKGKQVVDTTSRQELHRQRAEQKKAGQ